MATLVTNTLSDAAAKPNFVVASASDKGEIGNGVDTFLVIRNITASPITAVITPAGQTSYGTPLPPKSIGPIAATSGEAWVPLRRDYSNVDSNGTFTVTGATGASVAVVRVG